MTLTLCSTSRRAVALLVVALLAALITACASAPANPVSMHSPNDGPWRTSTIDGERGVMLEGHDAVAYFSQGQAVRGDRAHAVTHKGVVWRFANAANQAAFEQQPQQYMPQFGGFCSNGINYAIAGGGGGGPNAWRIYRGKLYVFGGQTARDHFEMNTDANLRLAHGYWNAEIAGLDAAVTRCQRMAQRVPHYQSDAQLQAQWDSMLAKRTLPVMPGAAQVVAP